MRHPFVTIACLTLLGCGGNWSEEDLVFASALPWRADLEVALPTGAGAAPSWLATRAAALELNRLLGQLLGVMDQARATAPSGRSSAGRSWGPFAAGGTSTAQLTLQVTRADERRFTWALPAQVAGGQALEVMRGETVAGATLREGTLLAHAALGAARELVPLVAPLDTLDTVDLEADQGATPRTLIVRLAFRAGATSLLSPTGYRVSRTLARTTLAFAFTRDEARAELSASWSATGEGRATGRLLDGPHAGASWTECWSTALETTYLREEWVGGAVTGDESACPALE